MFRFTIRDVLWLTALVALGLGWGREHYRRLQVAESIASLESEAQLSRLAIASLHKDIERIENDLPPHGLSLVWSRDLRPSVQRVASSTPSEPISTPTAAARYNSPCN